MAKDTQMKEWEAKNSFTGKTLTVSQFDESWALAEIIHRGIEKTGSFREKLTDYSHAYARSEKFDQLKGETIIRDIFKARYGETMNEMRLDMKKREENPTEKARTDALKQARRIEPMIRDKETMPFYRAYDHAAYTLAQHLAITETGAKELMKETFRGAESQELYDYGKAVEKEFHQPVREAAQQAREAKRDQTRSRARA